MNYKTLSLLLLSAASALAAPELQKRDTTDASGAAATEAADISIPVPPSSILDVLETAIPASVIAELDNSSGIAALASEVADGSVPGWYQSLPADVKSYLTSMYEEIEADSASAGATSTGGAPAATGAVALGLAGAAGILGLAIAL
ncbi:hypothetical protein ASPZODRAFT_91905 [Penicilliopsis zonata CBS 506.65]|uniref:Uncharacterized protein n=1 Tax=Penicilliopsis zonata CBS 506.65 TaxID=1073090 RepID=A0A1L9SQI6_9EURO|nr:hypothetical protein ASPZODRAFT_91905 [Penicilliopsis zonata CBS 506.65]OJJ49344.1 hypothetical protein ASPZODRAFT_91905 [Penicilliopsis zonata CBS 506.65]